MKKLDIDGGGEAFAGADEACNHGKQTNLNIFNGFERVQVNEKIPALNSI
jgi:hypothetical protein